MKRISLIALVLVLFVIVAPAKAQLLDESFESKRADAGLSLVSTQRAPFAELASFSATQAGDQRVELRWQTAREIQLSHFVVLRSLDGINYEEAALVFAVGNSQAARNYAVADKLTAARGTAVYYRLVMVDTNKKAYASDLLTLNTVR